MHYIDIRAYGSLQQAAERGKSQLRGFTPDTELHVLELLQQLGIPRDHVQLIMVNHRAVTADMCVRPGDRVALFPQEYPIFPDWKDFR